MSKRIVRASVIQCCTEKYDLEATLRKLERLVHIAKERDGAELAVFPEALWVCCRSAMGILNRPDALG
jgi:beta-cyano-L-alanine hydratase/nitrilase